MNIKQIKWAGFTFSCLEMVTKGTCSCSEVWFLLVISSMGPLISTQKPESLHCCSESSLIHTVCIDLDQPGSFLLPFSVYGDVSQCVSYLWEQTPGVSFPPPASARTFGSAPPHPLAGSCRLWPARHPVRRGPRWRSGPFWQMSRWGTSQSQSSEDRTRTRI